VRWLEAHPLSAQQIFQRLREAGYRGGLTIVNMYVRRIRPPKRKAFLKLTFAPGECAQIDWGEYGSVGVGSTRRRLSFFVMVQCYSRQMYVEFTVSQTMEHFLGCHERAFAVLGVPTKIMVDNLKSAVLRRLTGAAPVFNPRYVDYARHHSFEIAPCNVAAGNEKGRVESGVGYVKKNFLNGMEFTDFSAVNPAAQAWLNEISNVREHGETHRRPVDLFAEERGFLRTANPNPYDLARVIPLRASSQFRITLDTNRYSVPAEFANQRLTVKAYPDRICIYHQDRLIARHLRSFDRHQDIEDPDHPKALLEQRKSAVNSVCYRSSWRSRAKHRRITKACSRGASTPADTSAKSSLWRKSMAPMLAVAPSTMRSSSTPSPANTSHTSSRPGRAPNCSPPVRSPDAARRPAGS